MLKLVIVQTSVYHDPKNYVLSVNEHRTFAHRVIVECHHKDYMCSRTEKARGRTHKPFSFSPEKLT